MKTTVLVGLVVLLFLSGCSSMQVKDNLGQFKNNLCKSFNGTNIQPGPIYHGNLGLGR